MLLQETQLIRGLSERSAVCSGIFLVFSDDEVLFSPARQKQLPLKLTDMLFDRGVLGHPRIQAFNDRLRLIADPGDAEGGGDADGGEAGNHLADREVIGEEILPGERRHGATPAA